MENLISNADENKYQNIVTGSRYAVWHSYAPAGDKLDVHS
jgi:hypothetical protein